LQTPGLFGYIENGTFIGISTTAAPVPTTVAPTTVNPGTTDANSTATTTAGATTQPPTTAAPTAPPSMYHSMFMNIWYC